MKANNCLNACHFPNPAAKSHCDNESNIFIMMILSKIMETQVKEEIEICVSFFSRVSRYISTKLLLKCRYLGKKLQKFNKRSSQIKQNATTTNSL